MMSGFNIVLPKLYLCTSPKQFNTLTKRLQLPAPNWEHSLERASASTHLFHEIETGEPLFIVTLDLQKDMIPPVVISILVHESVHVWQGMCNSYCERAPGEETEAYTIQAIFNELFDKFMGKEVFFKLDKELLARLPIE